MIYSEQHCDAYDTIDFKVEETAFFYGQMNTVYVFELAIQSTGVKHFKVFLDKREALNFAGTIDRIVTRSRQAIVKSHREAKSSNLLATLCNHDRVKVYQAMERSLLLQLANQLDDVVSFMELRCKN